MSIVLFMMFLFSGLMITLICRFTVFSEYEYTQGMYLGVHIPPEEKGSQAIHGKRGKKTEDIPEY